MSSASIGAASPNHIVWSQAERYCSRLPGDCAYKIKAVFPHCGKQASSFPGKDLLNSADICSLSHSQPSVLMHGLNFALEKVALPQQPAKRIKPWGPRYIHQKGETHRNKHTRTSGRRPQNWRAVNQVAKNVEHYKLTGARGFLFLRM